MEWGQVHILIRAFKTSWVSLGEFLQAHFFPPQQSRLIICLLCLLLQWLDDRAGCSCEVDRELHSGGATPLLRRIDWAPHWAVLMWSRGPPSCLPFASLLLSSLWRKRPWIGQVPGLLFPSLTLSPMSTLSAMHILQLHCFFLEPSFLCIICTVFLAHCKHFQYSII